ncbi:MAG: 2-hydroxyacid dehydrogenase [Janthinobacterium lividum]
MTGTNDQVRPRVAVLARLPQDLQEALAERYELVGHDPAGPPRPSLRLAVTTSMAGADERAMASLPELGFLGCQGVGLDRIDLPAAARRGIVIAHTPDVLTEDVADFAIALMYGMARRLVEADRFVRAGRWARERMVPSMRLHGKQAGVVGLGRIGGAIARRAAGIGMVVAFCNPTPRPGVPFERVADLLSLARRSDVLFLASPGGAGTERMVDAAVLEALGPEGILVNVSRGSVVDEAALLDALREGGIAGAGLDVFAAEPGLDQRFLGLDNVVLAPHYASLTRETRRDMIALILRNMAAWLEGRPVPDAARDARPTAGLAQT